MSPAFLLLLALGLSLAGWLAARARAWSFRRAAPARWLAVPVLLFVLAWSAIAPQLVAQSVLASPAAVDLPPFGLQRETILGEARNVATGAAPAVFNPAARGLVEPYREAIGRYDLI